MQHLFLNCDGLKRKIYFDSTIKLRSFKIILKKEDSDEYRQHTDDIQKNIEVCLDECKIILSPSEDKQFIPGRLPDVKEKNKKSVRRMVPWLPNRPDFKVPALVKNRKH